MIKLIVNVEKAEINAHGELSIRVNMKCIEGDPSMYIFEDLGSMKAENVSVKCYRRDSMTMEFSNIQAAEKRVNEVVKEIRKQYIAYKKEKVIMLEEIKKSEKMNREIIIK